MASSTGGSGARKHGRAGRKPSHHRYNTEQRWVKNKAKRIEKERKRQERFEKRKELNERKTIEAKERRRREQDQ